jgi:hypothetical protein
MQPEGTVTDAEWLACSKPDPMLEALRAMGKLSERKARLFAVACCRRLWNVVDSDNRRLGEVIERYADGDATAEEMQAIAEEAHDNDWTAALAFEDAASDEILESAEHAAGNAAHAYADHLTGYPGPSLGPDGAYHWTDPTFVATRDAEWRLQAALIRDILGPTTFRSIRIDPEWLVAVNPLAQAAYTERKLPEGTLDNTRLAVLADALEEVGCTDQEILRHLREPAGVHVRGCFALDLLLDKT